MSNPTLVAFPKENWEYYEKMFLLINCTVGSTEQESFLLRISLVNVTKAA